MSSLRRKIASRANGARSKGPVTPEGKKRSSANAIRHGLLASVLVLEIEARQGFDELSAGLIERLKPADDVELALVEEMLSALWRQRRAWAIENHLMDDAIAAQDPESGTQRDRLAAAFAVLAPQPQLGLLHRYEARLHRSLHRALRSLLLLRAATPEIPGDQTNLVPQSDTPGAPPDTDTPNSSEPL